MDVETLLQVGRETADERLIRECIEGNEQAWSALVDKYRKLVFSIPIRYGLSREDASEVFQEVCLTLVSELPRLRDPKTLPAWLIRVTANKSLKWRVAQHRMFETRLDPNETKLASDCEPSSELLEEVLREQALRDAIAELQPRCVALVEMLFFKNPPVPYEDVAKRLALAKGSIGFIRMRCLERLRRNLMKKGF